MSYLTHPEAIEAMEQAKSRLMRLWLPPSEMTISEWAENHRRLPEWAARPGRWRNDPIHTEIAESMCDPKVKEVVFMKSTQLGWSELLNNAIAWAIVVHAMRVLMLQPSRDTAEKYCKERLEEMIGSTPELASILRQATSKKSGSTTRFKSFSNGGNLFVASAGNPRELRSSQARLILEDEVDGWPVEVGKEGDPDKIVRRRGDTFWDLKVFVGSTPALPSGLSRIEKAYNRSSMGRFLCPCPHCNAMEPFRWRDPASETVYLLKFEKDANRQVVPESVHWTCIRCGGPIEEKWKIPMMEAGHWQHERPDLMRVRGFFANGLYAATPDHWLKMAQEWVDAQGNSTELKSFINLNLAETYEEKGESVEPTFLRRRADACKRPRAEVPVGVAVLIVTVDVQTAGAGRLEAQVVGITPDEQGLLVDLQTFAGDPTQDDVWEDLDHWLLAGWRHQNGAQMTPHLVLVDARDGHVRDAVYKFCEPRAHRWVFPQMGVGSLASKGWAEESSSKKNTIKLFLTSTDDVKRALFSRLGQAVGSPKSISLPAWVSDEYLNQITAEKRIPITDPRTRVVTYKWIKRRDRNEGLDLWAYALSGWWILSRILAPHLGGADGRMQMEALARQAAEAHSKVTYPGSPGRRVRSRGVS